jgi:hypothetical protein
MQLNKVFKSVGHYFAVLVQDIPVAISWLGKANSKLVEVAATVDAHKGKLLGDALAVVKAASEAEQARGLNLSLDAAFIQSLKQTHRRAIRVGQIPAGYTRPAGVLAGLGLSGPGAPDSPLPACGPRSHMSARA